MALDNVDRSIINLNFLYYALLSRGLQDTITGAAQPQITRANLSRVTVPVPPLAEQKRIVELLDEADELRKLRAQADRRTGDLISALFYEMFGDPEENPHSWSACSLGSMGKITTGNTPSRGNTEFFGEYIERIKTDNIDVTRGVVSKASEWLSEKGAKIGRTISPESVLISCIAGSRNRLGDAAINDRRVAINQQINAITPESGIEPAFLCQLVVSLKSVIQHRATGVMTGIINKSNLAAVPAMCPPHELQKAFSQRVTEIRATEAEQAASRKRLDELFQSILHRAF